MNESYQIQGIRILEYRGEKIVRSNLCYVCNFKAVTPSAEEEGAGLSVSGTSVGGTISSLFVVEVRTSSVFRVDSGASFEGVDSLCACGSAGVVESRGPV
jgi:hypothetical protein